MELFIKRKKYLLILALLLVSGTTYFLGYKISYSAVYQQTITTSEYPAPFISNSPKQPIGNGLSGSLLEARWISSNNATTSLIIIECNTFVATSTYGNACDSGEQNAFYFFEDTFSINDIGGGYYQHIWATSTPFIQLNPDKYYTIYTGFGGTLGLGGVSPLPNTQCFQKDGGYCSPVVFAYYYLSTGEVATTTRILSFDFPENNSTVDSVFQLEADYYFNSVQDFGKYDQVCFQFNSLTNLQSIIPICTPINQSGTVSFNTTTGLPSGRYSVRFVINGVGLQPDISSNYRVFCVEECTPFNDNISLIPQPETDEQATTTLQSNFNSIFDFYTIITNKFPFNWVTGIGASLLDLRDLATTSPDFSPFTVNFGSIDLEVWEKLPNATSTSPVPVSTSLTLFSTTTIQTIADQSWVQTMRTLASFFMWFLFGRMIVGLGMSLFNNPNKT